MPLLTIVWFLFSLLSLAVWGGAGYLLWSWYDGDAVRGIDGSLIRHREEWRLWIGLALVSWGLLGRFIVSPLIAKSDRKKRRFARGEGRTIQSDAGALYVEERGAPNGPAIVFTHGQGLDSTIWTELANTLAKDFRVIIWDLPGLGRSRGGRGEFDPANGARALMAVMRETNAGPALLVGHSFGGMTIQELAKLDATFFRDFVSGVALLNTTYTNPLRTMIFSGFFSAMQKPVLEPGSHLTMWLQPIAWLNIWQSYLSGAAHLANRIQFSRDVTRSLLDHATLLASRSAPASIERRNLGMFHWLGLDHAAINKPTLVIAGGRDIVTKREAGEEIARRIPGARLQVVEAANHMGPFEQIDLYANALRAFAADTRARPFSAAAE